VGAVKSYVYHYSVEDYCGPHFNPGTHFGTLRAAHDRWSNLARLGGCLAEVRLDMVNPFRTFDQGDWEEPLQFYWELVGSDEVMGQALEELGFEWPWDGADWDKDQALLEAEYILKRRGKKSLSDAWYLVIDELAAQGYDGIAYANDVEDPGSLSYIIFWSDQVHVEAVALLPEYGTTLEEFEQWWLDPPLRMAPRGWLEEA
jgi:hypothetical protein